MAKECMLDLETLDSTPSSAVIAIGAVIFDPADASGYKEIDRYYTVVDPRSCVSAGLTIGTDTVMWWMEQSEQARSQFFKDRPKSKLVDALDGFAAFLAKHTDTRGNIRVWGNGASFDNVILGNAYRALGKPQPWKFWNDMCYRTLKNLMPSVELRRGGTYHRADDDAATQAEHLYRIWQQLLQGR